MEPLSTSVYTLENLIGGGFQYIDKTGAIHNLLLSKASGQFFLSRPRRFGKSLLRSTLKAIFLGKRALFDGLAISETGYDWKTYPVIHIDLGTSQSRDADELERKLIEEVDEQARVNGINLSALGAASRLKELILNLSRSGRVVILVDEYDKPLLGALDNPKKAGELLPVLKTFYSVIKGTESVQRFVLLTGVSKFSKVSVFSDLNNLTDLTMDSAASTLLGYTQAELETNFSEHIDSLAERENLSRGDMLEKIRLWYNGYRFSKNTQTVYNPVSVMRLFDSGEFLSYWFETDTPSFLIQLLKRRGLPPSELSAMRLGEQGFSAYEVDNLAPEPLLYQTGYVTIKNYDSVSRLYTLGYPNLEVENAFVESLVDAFTSVGKGRIEALVYDISTSIEQADLERFFSLLRVVFAAIPYEIQISNEKYYQTVFHLILTLLGLRTQVEVRTEAGRIDAVIETKEYVFIFEFKLKGLAKTALKQIKDKRYFEKYLASGKRIVLIGAVFDKKTRNLGKYLAEWQ